ncbi:hypothetical protein CLOM_g7975, partial [Closterium sp. NIES-68]
LSIKRRPTSTSSALQSRMTWQQSFGNILRFSRTTCQVDCHPNDPRTTKSSWSQSTSAQPTVRTQWRLTQPELHELRNQLDYLLAKEFIRPSTSPFTAPIIFTPKKDGGLRMCMDYRALNRVTIKSCYPISRTDELIDNLRGARYFSKINLRGSYHQIWVFADDYHKTVFRTRYGSYEYTVMPFGLTNAPSTFQLTMNGVFHDLLDKCVIIYLDGILTYSTTREQHLKDLEAALKNRLMSPPVLHIADPERPFEVITDASDIAIGAVLMQDFGNGLQPIAYKSQKMQSAERNYPVHDKEMLAIVHTFKIWKCYLTGADVTVRTDHKSLQYLRAQPNLNPRQIRWLEYLESNFTYKITYKKGANNIADALSRPSAQLATVLAAQSNPRFYYWPDMVTDVQRYVAACPICQQMKSSHQRPTGLLQPLEPARRPWQYVTMDFVTGLPAGSSGNHAVFVVVDRLTKMAHFAPCRTIITAEETARPFISTVVRLHRIPAAIISDRDLKFTSKFWQDTWARNGTCLQFSSAYHSQTGGLTERTNQTMEQLIRTNCPNRNKWEDALPMLECSYNNASSATTNHSPFYLNYGMDPIVPISTNVESQVPRSQQFVEELQTARDKAVELIHKANATARWFADLHRRDMTMAAGQLVLLDTKNLRLPLPTKLRPRFCGPFKIMKMVTTVTAQLRLPDDWRSHNKFHLSL